MICYRDRTFCPFLECIELDCPVRLTEDVKNSADRIGLLISQYIDKPDCFKEK